MFNNIKVMCGDLNPCPICLEELNGNIQSFCCGTFHKTCLVRLMKNTKKCPLCRQDYEQYAKYIKDTDTNFNQAIYRSIEDINIRFNILLVEFRNKIMDLIARTTNLEINVRRLSVKSSSTDINNIPNKIINNHSMRIGNIESQLNNLTK